MEFDRPHKTDEEKDFARKNDITTRRLKQ